MDLREVEKKIKDAVAPLVQRIEELEKQVQALTKKPPKQGSSGFGVAGKPRGDVLGG
ncbi:MAG: hypothetical protein ACLQOO_23820 [Terriglobia bacterium]